jgi:NADH:ubiquinone reductase (H+-translocating)
MKKGKEKHVVIIGAGFAGLWAVKTLFNKKNARVTLIDKNNYHTFQPLLYQIGAAEIEPEQIAYPIRSLLRHRSNVSFLKADVKRINYKNKYILCNNQTIAFDYCIIATGSRTNYFSVAGASRFAFPLKTLDEAIILRNHILSCFERAAYVDDKERRKKLLTFVVIGGGPTGVEFAGALSELVRGPLDKDFRGTPLIKETSIILIEATDRLLPMLSARLANYTAEMLRKMGVTVSLKSSVKEINDRGIRFADGSIMETETAIWTAGVSGDMPESDAAIAYSPSKRIKVLPTLEFPEYKGLFAAGDLVYIEEYKAPLPMIAPVAIQQGKHAAENILRLISGEEPVEFRYKDKGTMVTIGRNRAVTRAGRSEFMGYIAWIMWIIIHILNLIGFRNKLFVFISWIWDYLFFERSVRLILPECCNDPSWRTCIHRCKDK